MNRPNRRDHHVYAVIRLDSPPDSVERSADHVAVVEVVWDGVTCTRYNPMRYTGSYVDIGAPFYQMGKPEAAGPPRKRYQTLWTVPCDSFTMTAAGLSQVVRVAGE